MAELDFMSVLHKSTKRDYLARVNDPEYPKAKAAELAKKFAKIRMAIDVYVTGLSLSRRALGKSCTRYY